MADDQQDPTEWVELGHPEVDGTHRKPRRSLRHWVERGWFEVGPATSEPPAVTDVPPPAKHPRTTTGQES